MSDEKHVPYKQAPGGKNADGINDLIANEKSGDPEIPNGWENGIDKSTAKENA
jgi:hypothetical protein